MKTDSKEYGNFITWLANVKRVLIFYKIVGADQKLSSKEWKGYFDNGMKPYDSVRFDCLEGNIQLEKKPKWSEISSIQINPLTLSDI